MLVQIKVITIHFQLLDKRKPDLLYKSKIETEKQNLEELLTLSLFKLTNNMNKTLKTTHTLTGYGNVRSLSDSNRTRPPLKQPIIRRHNFQKYIFPNV